MNPQAPNINSTTQSLAKLENSHVRVAIVPDGITRNHFGPQIAVAGTLEIKKDQGGNPHYRVLSDEENFSYFLPENVILVSSATSIPTITLTIPVTSPVKS